MPPNSYYNRILFKPIHPRTIQSNETRKNRVYKMSHPGNTIGPIETQKNRIYRNRLLNKTKRKLTRNTRGNRYLIPKHTPKRVDFSSIINGSNASRGFLQNEKNTRGKVNFMNPNLNVNESNSYLISSRFSRPMSNSYTRPYGREKFNVKRKWSTNDNAVRNKSRVNYGPKEAKMMANITSIYNNPLEMLDAVEALNLSDDMKEKFTNDITLMYNLYNSE